MVRKGGLKLNTAKNIAKKHKDDKEAQVKAATECCGKNSRKGKGKPGPEANGHPPSDPSVGDEAGGTSGQREKALTAAAEVKNYLMRSPLMRIGVNNPFRDYAFQEVMRWLRRTQKGKQTNGR
jgi:hypothetical protein